MIYCDGGSTYTKILDNHGRVKVLPTQEMLKDKTKWFDIATGHATKNCCTLYVNELIALAQGTLSLIKDDNFTVVDIGSRDTKYIIVKNRKVVGLDWNTSCGGNLGFTLELLGHYYNLNYNQLQPNKEKVQVTCGLLGIEKIFDEINKGLLPGEGVAKFIHGLAFNIFQFCHSPSLLYLSGGLTENLCFVQTLEQYCEVKTLGRDILLKGLVEIGKKNFNRKGYE
jgi:activator of 2-hydroxyglutaryl-CoA dehydratase